MHNVVMIRPRANWRLGLYDLYIGELNRRLLDNPVFDSTFERDEALLRGWVDRRRELLAELEEVACA